MTTPARTAWTGIVIGAVLGAFNFFRDHPAWLGSSLFDHAEVVARLGGYVVGTALIGAILGFIIGAFRTKRPGH